MSVQRCHTKLNQLFASKNVTLLPTTNNGDTQQTSFLRKSTPPPPLHLETMHTVATSRVLVAAAVEQMVPGRLHRHVGALWTLKKVHHKQQVDTG